MKVHIYEHVTAGGLSSDVAESLRREGAAMLNAVVADFERVPGVEMADHDGDWTLVIAPEFDGLLRDLSQTVLDDGGRLLGSAPKAIELAGDKLATAIHWQKRGVPHPRTELIDVLDPARFPAPCVVKPRDGAGSQATFLIRDHTERETLWLAARMEWPGRDLIVQSYLPGLAASVALLIGPTHTIPLMPASQRLSTDGRFHYLGGSLPLPTPLAERATRLALQAVAGIEGLRGYVGVDLVLGENGNDFAIEINPRLTTSYLGLRQLCEQNLAELMLRCVQGEVIAAPTWRDGEVVFMPQ